MHKVPIRQPSADQFHHLLPSCQTLQEIRDLVQRLGTNLQQTPRQSREILRHVLSSDWGISTIHEFLLDGRLHTSGSGCYEELLKWITSKPQSKVHLESLMGCIRDSLKLGLLSGRDVQMLLKKLGHISIDLQGTIVKLGDTEFMQDWYWMMADAMRNCPIFSLKDLGRDHLQHWSHCVAEAPFAYQALDTFLIVQRDLADSAVFKVNTTQGLVQKWIKHTQRAQQQQALGLTETHQPEIKPDHAKVADFLAALHPIVAVRSICQITEKLVRDIVKATRQPMALDYWTQILSSFSRLSADTILQDRGSRDCLCKAAAPTVFSSRQSIVVRLWIATQLTAQASKDHHSSALQDLTRHLLCLFEEQIKPEQDLLAELIFTLQSLPLPSPSAVLQRVARSCVGHLQFHGSIENLQADTLRISKSRIAIFKEDHIYKNAKINLNDHIVQLAERVNTNPEDFLQAALALIMRDKLSIKIITRILRHNLALNLSLALAASPTIQTQAQQRQSTASSLNPPSHPHSAILPPNPPSMSPSVALHILNSLARSFALSPILTPRQSFRKVYWIYLHLHRYTKGVAIGPDITRALWHSGVTRYKETGTSPEKVKWILGKVREVEGGEVADQLLWFGAGGVREWEEWMRRGGGEDEEGWRRVVNRKVGFKELEERGGRGG